MKIVAIVGMAGAGKTEVAEILRENGFSYVRFGQAVIDEVRRQGLEINEENERKVREEMREDHGMAAMAKFLVPTFQSLLQTTDIVADGLYSWEEYTLLKEKFGDDLFVLAVYASPQVRYNRLTQRKLLKTDKDAKMRPLSEKEAVSRDYSAIENLNKGGPIAMADATIINQGTMKELETKVLSFIESLK